MTAPKKGSSKSQPQVQSRNQQLQRDLEWSRFSLELEEKLGDLLEIEPLLQRFSDLLKTRLAYDYLEISILPNSLPGEESVSELSDWVRNDTGYGGKLLTIILQPKFQKRLRSRRKPLPITRQNAPALVDNPELLKIMNLRSGLLVPLFQEQHTSGVLKMFFCRELPCNAEAQTRLMTAAAILTRCLKRTYLFQKAQKLAILDGLTGLYNHRYFMEQLSREFQRSRRYRSWLSLIIIDIDFFKHYNDTNGHLAGDNVLKKVATTIKNSVREMDLVARWGGEEFALLLPEINGANGMVVAEKIRREVEAQHFQNQQKQPQGNLTISLGVAENSPQLKNHRELFNLADTALYRAKLDGRNRCALAK